MNLLPVPPWQINTLMFKQLAQTPLHTRWTVLLIALPSRRNPLLKPLIKKSLRHARLFNIPLEQVFPPLVLNMESFLQCTPLPLLEQNLTVKLRHPLSVYLTSIYFRPPSVFLT